MSPFVFPGLQSISASPYVMPGFRHKRHAALPQITSIFKNVQFYFKVHCTDNNRRQRHLVKARFWTMFLAICLGHSSLKAAAFFGKDHSTALHACKRVMGDIDTYKQPRADFTHFMNIYTISPQNIQSNQVKSFIKSWKTRQIT